MIDIWGVCLKRITQEVSFGVSHLKGEEKQQQQQKFTQKTNKHAICLENIARIVLFCWKAKEIFLLVFFILQMGKEKLRDYCCCLKIDILLFATLWELAQRLLYTQSHVTPTPSPLKVGLLKSLSGNAGRNFPHWFHINSFKMHLYDSQVGKLWRRIERS